MPRRREVPKRLITPDPKFKDKLVSKFTNTLMYGGKKATAEGILYGALDVITERFKEDPLEVFRKALDNVKPKLEVKSRRVGGATYQSYASGRCPRIRRQLDRLSTTALVPPIATRFTHK